jgi:hypothetical protein
MLVTLTYYVNPAPEQWRVGVAPPTTHKNVAMPYCARVLLPVVAVPANLNVTDAPAVIVWFDAELFTMVIISPAARIEALIVTPPVDM